MSLWPHTVKPQAGLIVSLVPRWIPAFTFSIGEQGRGCKNVSPKTPVGENLATGRSRARGSTLRSSNLWSLQAWHPVDVE